MSGERLRSCEQFREQIPECLAGRLDSGTRENLIAHLELCSACRADMAQIGVVWRGLESLPAVEPNPAMKARFLEVLEAYQSGMQQGQQRAASRRAWWFAGWWPARAVWQTALALALLLAGGFGGQYLTRPRTAPEISQLQGQLEQLRQTVALSMLQDDSSISRIRGVSFGAQVNKPGQEIEQALLQTLTHDSNVNVRLSAVDALERLAGNPDIRRALVDAMPMQDSPLVQIALMDVLVQANEKSALPLLRRLAGNLQGDATVRQRAAAGVEKLEKSK